jgi:hypothetical protein
MLQKCFEWHVLLLLLQVASKDKDFRYMATSDLLNELSKDNFQVRRQQQQQQQGQQQEPSRLASSSSTRTSAGMTVSGNSRQNGMDRSQAQRASSIPVVYNKPCCSGCSCPCTALSG